MNLIRIIKKEYFIQFKEYPQHHTFYKIMKPTGKKINPAPKGFGFADAMFGIKDIAMEY